MAKVKFGADELVVELEKYDKEIEKWVKKGIIKTTNAIANEAKARAPVNLGHLRSSITTEILDGGMTGKVNVGANYAIYVEFGTGIYAKGPGGSRAKKIPWTYFDEERGKFVTTKGQQAQPFWNPAIDKGRQVFANYFS